MKKIIVLVLLSCCTFLFGAEKVVIERKADSEIQSIVVEKDSLTIKSKGKTYTFKFSELLKDKTVEIKAVKTVPKNLSEAFKYNGQWFFFNASRRMFRFKQKGQKIFRRDELLERVLYKNKYYVRDLNKDIFLPDWKIKKDSSQHFIPAKQYIEYLDNQIKSLKTTIIMLERKNFRAKNIIRTYREKYILLLKNNNLTITMLDKNGNIIRKKKTKNQYSSELKFQLRHYYKNIKAEEKDLKSSKKRLKSLKNKLANLQKLKQKVDILYRKYVDF